MFEPGGESVRCQNLHEPLLSPSTFEPTRFASNRLYYSTMPFLKNVDFDLQRVAL